MTKSMHTLIPFLHGRLAVRSFQVFHGAKLFLHLAEICYCIAAVRIVLPASPGTASGEYSSHRSARDNPGWLCPRLSYFRRNCRCRTSCPACHSACTSPGLASRFITQCFQRFCSRCMVEATPSGRTALQTWSHFRRAPCTASAAYRNDD